MNYYLRCNLEIEVIYNNMFVNPESILFPFLGHNFDFFDLIANERIFATNLVVLYSYVQSNAKRFIPR